jgi:hypothetical protein
MVVLPSYLQGLPPLEPLGQLEEVKAEDVLEPAGSVLSVVDGLVVVQGPANSRALADGWVSVQGVRA